MEITGKYASAKVFTDDVDLETITQVLTVCNQPFVKDSKVRIMPDCHAGAGCVIGTTMTIQDKVCPNLVGVDISCGMLMVKMPKNIPLDLALLDKVVHEQVPAGFDVHAENTAAMQDVLSKYLHLEELYCWKDLEKHLYFERSLGTLGGGNHFIELDTDEEGNIYLVIHTGSRNLGKQVADYYQKMAEEDCNGAKRLMKEADEALIQKLKDEGRQTEIAEELKKLRKNFQVPEKVANDLCYLSGKHMESYLHDAAICQRYSHFNRILIAEAILGNYLNACYGTKDGACWIEDDLNDAGYENGVTEMKFEVTETLHNYIDMAHMVLRKGAVSAQKDELLLIPMNMRDGSLVCRGKGNPDWNCSAPHGAGRLMSRSEAKKNLSLEEYQKQMQGIYSSCIGTETIDEAPMVYKPMDEIIRCIEPTVEIIAVIKPIYNFKAG